VRPDLTSANLRGANLAGMDLSGSLLSLANLRKAVLSGANLRDCNLPRACLEDADLSGAKLQGANLAGATLLRANFSGANMRMANLAGANLAGKMDLSGVDLTGANLAGAKLMGANFSGATLTGANLAGADARNANFTGADLTNAITAGALLDGANMSGAVIRQTPSRPQTTVAEPEAPPAPVTSELPQVFPVEPISFADFDAAPDQAEVSSSDLEPGFEAEEEWDRPAPAELNDTPEADLEPEPEANLQPEPEADLAPEPAPEQIEDPSDEPANAGLELEAEIEAPALESMAEGVSALVDAPPVPGLLAESEISDLLADSEMDTDGAISPLAEDEAADEDSQESPFYTYETRELAILALYLDQVSRKTKAEKAMLLDLLVQYNRNFLGQDVSVPMTTSGNAILVGFSDPTNALRCGGLYISMLRDMHVESYVAINWSMAAVRIDPEGIVSDELIANSISPSARLMPVGVVGEVLVLEELYSNPLTQRDLFTFERVARKWKAANDTKGEGIAVICYSVRSKPPSRP